MDSAVLVLIGAVASAFIAAVFALLQTWLTTRAQTRQREQSTREARDAKAAQSLERVLAAVTALEGSQETEAARADGHELAVAANIARLYTNSALDLTLGDLIEAGLGAAKNPTEELSRDIGEIWTLAPDFQECHPLTGKPPTRLRSREFTQSSPDQQTSSE